MQPDIYDVAIIGAGPTGLFTVFQCGMLGLRTCVIDALPEIGGQCTALYPEKPIYDIPGFPAVLAGELIDRLEEQAAPFQPVYYLGEQVKTLTPDQATGVWIVSTSVRASIQARTIVIAAGAGSFGPNRPPLQDIEIYEGKSVHYMVKRREDFRGKNVVIAGGGDSAVDWAVSLANVAGSITFVHRRDQFRALPESVTRMRTLAAEGKIDIITPYQLHALEGKDGFLTAVIISTMEKQEKRLKADVLLPFFGLAAHFGPLESWGLALDKHGIFIDPTTAETNLQGVYAIGDIASYSNKLKLILTGFAEAANAAHAIYKRLHPHQALHQEYSTTRGIPQAALNEVPLRTAG